MSADVEIRAAKAEMRRQAQVRRAAAAARFASGEACERIAAQGAAVIGKLLGTSAANPPRTVSAYLAMGDELDPLPLCVRLIAAGWRLAMPVVVAKGRPLIFRLWQPGEPTIPAGLGTREPDPSSSTVMPDLLLVPLLAFDRQGWRLGYGGGFYDRTLRQLRAMNPILAAGIAYDEQEVGAVPHHAGDERLDLVLTPSVSIDCRTMRGVE
jgi:5-formyltetrahydrofolate cyclo-ligase